MSSSDEPLVLEGDVAPSDTNTVLVKDVQLNLHTTNMVAFCMVF